MRIRLCKASPPQRPTRPSSPSASWTIRWGDGAVETINGNPTSATHTYASAPAAHTISAFATDTNGINYEAEPLVLDKTFGGGDGIVTTDFATRSDTGRRVAVQADGKIVVVGSVESVEDDWDFGVAR